MNAAEPWENLRFVSKVEIVPAPGKRGVIAWLEEDHETYSSWDHVGPTVMISSDRKVRITDEVVRFHYDYPDDFKKLVYHFGDKVKAYHAYNALQRSVPEKWDICDKDGEFDCDC